MQDKYTQISSFLYGRNNKCINLIEKISFVIAIKTWIHLAKSLYEDNFNEEHEWGYINRKAYCVPGWNDSVLWQLSWNLFCYNVTLW